MIKIINEINGKKYELALDVADCEKCAFAGLGISECDEVDRFYGEQLCVKYNGIWKEVKDEDK